MNYNFLYSNPENVAQVRETNSLKALNYTGKNQRIRQLQRVLTYLQARKVRKGKRPTKVYLGSLLFNIKENVWYFTAVNGEKFRIPEPTEGIEEIFEVEYKRVE